MRATLVEVLGKDRGEAMYTLGWLRDRARFHVDPSQCAGEIFLAEIEGEVVGHTIVRIERGSDGAEFGLFSTTYVAPEFRGQGVATALVETGEAWMRDHGMTRAVTDTADANAPLLELFRKRGYQVVESADDMVRLTRELPLPG